jgi:hypothetical protein
MRRSLLLLAWWGALHQPSAAADADCRIAKPLRMIVRFSGEASREVLLESTLPAGFRLLDPSSRNEIWSTGPDSTNTQVSAAMDADFGASFTAVHLDADGVHDLLYAGDHAGRIWRFDLRSDARPTAWMHATVIASLGATGGGRSFIAPPDVAFITSSSGHSWLNIALGTANTAEPRTDHRFYVLRDSLTERRQVPLVEADLEQLAPPARVARENANGYFLTLGSAQVLAQSLTLNGHVHFVTVESARNLMAACRSGMLPTAPVELSVTVLRAEDGMAELQPGTEASTSGNARPQLRRRMAGALPAGSGVELATTPGDSHGRVPCIVGEEPLPACFLDTRPRRSWWRREDAD